MRVVSLLPSATELCYELGVEPVAVSHECDYPARAREQPTVIHSRVETDGTSQEINEEVTEALESGGVYELDRERLAALEPDIILSQGTCEVCAVDDSEVRSAVAEQDLDAKVVTTDPHSLEDVLADIERLAALEPDIILSQGTCEVCAVDDSEVRSAVAEQDLDAEVVTTDPHSLEDVLADIERLGGVLERPERAAEVAAEYRNRVARVERATPTDGPTTAVLDWLDPAMVAGHWVPGMVARVGGSYGLAAPGERSRPREWSEIRAHDPEVLVASPCGFDLEQTVENLGELTARKGWAELTAVEQGRVYLVDGNQYINRPGPRLVETLELLAGIVHPGGDGTPDPADRSGVRRLAAVVDGVRDREQPA